jgi:type VI secretion system secreted protein VgrG
MASYSQADRIAEVKHKFGGDKLFLRRFSGSEGMSHLFEYRVEGVSDDAALDFDKQIGKNMTVVFHTDGFGDRYFTGTCVEAQRRGRSTQGFDYGFVLRPGLWVLSKRVNSRVFHNKKAPDVINEIFGDYGSLFTPEDKTQGDHPEMEYCVQHRESDLNFVLRLMEAAGISYHFKFGDDSQTVVLCDSESTYEDAPGSTREYFDDEQFHVAERKEHFYRLTPERRFTTGKAVLTDYKLQAPDENNLGENEADDMKYEPKLEDYRHPFPQHLGEKTSADYGKGYAEVRTLSERRTDGRYLLSGTCASLAPGHKVTLKNHPTDDGEYVVVGCAHTVESQDYRTAGSGGVPYRGEYEVMKVARFVPPIVTPKPIVGGVQTGVVVGDNTAGSDNEIHTDEWGRIRVHMHWNREDKGKAEGQTMWCRVLQSWTGQNKKWGTIFIPRVGTEVLVSFIDGDPDRPVVVGTVYHDKNKPPYDLPDEPFKAGWKSNFEGDDGYNEIMMIDKSGDEKINVYTDHELVTEVMNNETRTVHVDRDVEIKNNDTKKVGNELKVTAIAKITFTVGTSKITMDPTQITIESTMVTVKASAKLTTQSGGIAEHTAGGIMTIKGGLVTIN